MPARLALLTYAYVDDMATKREPYRDGHLALIAQFADEAAAEDFFANDPYATAGLITAHSIVPYTVVAAEPVDLG